jgi:hypothetical protein
MRNINALLFTFIGLIISAATFTVIVSPRVYVSWWGEEDGDLLMPRNAANIKRAKSPSLATRTSRLPFSYPIS